MGARPLWRVVGRETCVGGGRGETRFNFDAVSCTRSAEPVTSMLRMGGSVRIPGYDYNRILLLLLLLPLVLLLLVR